MKVFRFSVILIIILGTIIVSNYFIDYYEVTDVNKQLIQANGEFDSEANFTINSSILDEKDANIIFSATEKLTIADDDIEALITNNDDLKFFKNTKTLNIVYEELDDIPELKFDNTTIENLKTMPSLKTINLQLEIDDYTLKTEYGYYYTDEDEKEFVTKFEEKTKEDNKDTIKSLENIGLEVNLKFEVV